MSTIVQPRCGVKVRARRRHCVLGWNDDDDAMERKEIFRLYAGDRCRDTTARVDGRTEVGWNGMEWKRARPPCSRNERIAETRKGTRRRRTTNDGCVDNKLFVFLFTRRRRSSRRRRSFGRSFVRSGSPRIQPEVASVGGRVTRDSNDRSSFVRARSRPPLVQSSSFTSFSFCIPLRMVIICLPIFFIGPRMQMPHPTWMTFFSTDETKTDPLAMHFFVSRPLTGQRYDEARHRAEDLPRCPRFLRLQRLQG